MNHPVMMRTAGLLAVFGGIVNIYADYLLQGGLIPRAAVNTYEFLTNVPFDYIFWGSIIGNAAIPLWLLGFWPVYVALAPAGRWLALPPVSLLAYGFSLFPGYHGAYALYGAGFQASAEVSGDAPENLLQLGERLNEYHNALLVLIGLTVPLGSIWLVVLILFFRTHFAKWMVLASPIVAFTTQGLIEMLPAPVGGYIRPAWSTSIFTAFFLMATISVWHVHRTDGSGQGPQ